jgi:hypothetical protein
MCWSGQLGGLGLASSTLMCSSGPSAGPTESSPPAMRLAGIAE